MSRAKYHCPRSLRHLHTSLRRRSRSPRRRSCRRKPRPPRRRRLRFQHPYPSRRLALGNGAGGDIAAIMGVCKALIEADNAAQSSGSPRILDATFIDERLL